MTEDETVGWHHRLDGHESEQAPGAGDGQGGLVCCSPWGRKESDTTEGLNSNSNLVSALRLHQKSGGCGWQDSRIEIIKELLTQV